MTGTLADRLIAGERAALARAITLVESKRADHEAAGAGAAPGGAAAHRPRGAARDHRRARRRQIDTIDQLGMNLTGAGHRVAVLAVDPT